MWAGRSEMLLLAVASPPPEMVEEDASPSPWEAALTLEALERREREGLPLAFQFLRALPGYKFGALVQSESARDMLLYTAMGLTRFFIIAWEAVQEYAGLPEGQRTMVELWALQSPIEMLDRSDRMFMSKVRQEMTSWRARRECLELDAALPRGEQAQGARRI